jgi:uncharacterized protein YndB with AHSA1/START domain
MTRLTMLIALSVVFSAAGAAPARADVVDATDAGFSITIASSIKATPAAVFQAITGRVAAWWNPSHTFSGNPSNLTIDPRPGGCFCERLPSGGVQHMVVTHVNSPGLLVLHGGLGPLGTLAVAGSMSFAINPEAMSSSRLVLSYDVVGYAPKGLKSLAPAVDTVLTEQVQRLKNLVERGTP